MKNQIKSTLSLLLAFVFIVSLVSCSSGNNVWKDAVYLEDTELGNGAKTVIVEVKAEDKTVTFTVKTDKDTVGAALIEQGLISGDEGQFGLYVKVVNGITADYDVNQRYWAFYVDGELSMTGVDTTEINESSRYRLEYSK